MTPKIVGADAELANFVLGRESTTAGTGADTARLLLREIDGVSGGGTNHSQDWGRRYLASNGGCAYIDLGHLELCVPETRSAFDFTAAWHAMLRVADKARSDAQAELPPEERLHVLVNNSDGLGNSYGSHLNFLLDRDTWDKIFLRRLDYLLYLASYQVSSIVFTGQGKVGHENGTPPVDYQLSQRADFIETIVGPQTTYQRPLVNARDEPLCDTGARLHVIFYDSNLAHVANVLKLGVLQIVLAMIESDWVLPDMLLEDPIGALGVWSRDPSLEALAPAMSGMQLTAVEHQWLFLEHARRFIDSEDVESVVPRANEILLLWEDTLHKLESKEFASLTSRLDWVAKRSILERVLAEHSELGWRAPAIKHLDQIYASLNPEEGLYWKLAREGSFELVVPETDIERFVLEPPEDTRAWTRAMLLRASGEHYVDSVDWDRVRFRDFGGVTSTFELPDPAGATRLETEACFRLADTVDELTRMLGARREPPRFTFYGGPS